jgi:transposase
MTINTSKTKEELIEYINQLQSQVNDLSLQNKVYEERIKLLVQQKYGSNSDKIDINQINLFNEAEDTADETVVEPIIETEPTTNNTKKQPRSKKHILKDLPIKTVEH